MADQTPKRKVGRPKKLDRGHALRVALEGYWREGIYGMSLNEVCRRSNIAKPGLYREFGGEDGLMTAVLALYSDQVLSKLRDLLSSDLPVDKVLRGYANGLIEQKGHPPGCLMAEMRMAREQLGPGTTALLDQLDEELQRRMEAWIRRARDRGVLNLAVPIDVAARHIASQMVYAAMQAHRGVKPAQIRQGVSLSLSCYLEEPLWK